MSDRPEESSESTVQTAVKDVNVGRDFKIGSLSQTIKQISISLTDRQLKKRQAQENLLNKIKGEIEDLRSPSLYREKPIDLSKDWLSQEVESQLAKKILISRQDREPPSGKKMSELFDEASRKLLILGEPGAGKTIALWELALQLIDHAEEALKNDVLSAPTIPIVLSLATWKPNQSIKDWIIEELGEIGVSKELGRELFDQKQLFPLLDEFDRLSTADQENCIKAINELLQQGDQPDGLVVCSRRDEYKSHSKNNVRLKFEGAICLKALTNSQIQNYLCESIQQSELWENIQEDSSLLEIVKTPLFLGVLVWTLAPQSSSTGQRSEILKQWRHCQSKQELSYYFFKIFIDQMLGQEIESQVTQDRLKQLAKIVKEQSLAELVIENIQPSWWLSEAEEKAYNFTVRTVVGLVVGLAAGLYLAGWSHQPAILCVAILVGGVIGILSYFFIPFLERFPKLVSKLLSKILPGLIFFGLMYSPSSMILVELGDWDFLVLLTGIGVSVIFHGLSSLQIKTADKVEFSSGRAIRYVGFSLLLGVIFVPIHFLIQPELYAKNFSYGIYELFSFFLIGLLVGAIHGKEALIDLKRVPNQGIWITRNYSVMWFVIGGLLSGLFTVKMDGLDAIRSPAIALTVGLLSSLIGSSYSGLVCIKHLILRFMLYRKNIMPWNYTRFLDYATQRNLLQRVGGRYRFWNEFLREHFAEMTIEPIQKTSI